MNIAPSHDVLIVREITPSTTTPAGLLLPPSLEKDTIIKGSVLAAGPGKINAQGTTIPHGYEVGEIIVFERRRGLLVTYEGEKYIFINASEVFGIVEEVH